MKLQNFALRDRPSLLVAVLVTVLMPAAPSLAQITINSTGVVSGTVTLPNKNPNFNQGTTRVNTNSQGEYIRNGVVVYKAPNPNLVRMGSNGNFFVDFRGIPVVSTNGTLTSPVLLSGQLQPVQRFNHSEPVTLWGNVQDELVVQGRFKGIVLDPNTGARYQGTFNIRGQGPRYSDANGGTSPTVFDFQSHYNFQATPSLPPQVTVKNYSFSNMPVQLRVIVPAGLSPLSAGVSQGMAGNSRSGGTSAGFNSAEFQINRVVLEANQGKVPVMEPRSRVLLR